MFQVLFLFIVCTLAPEFIYSKDFFQIPESYFVRTSDWWEVTHPVLKEFREDRPSVEAYYLRKYTLDNQFIHSCYEYKLVIRETHSTLRSGSFCYPAILVSGAPNCSTSALYQLIRTFPNVRTFYTKEICLEYYVGQKLHNFFDMLTSIPLESLQINQVILNGCILLKSNLFIREILHNPNSFYIVLVRNYADWLWSAYNYWCDVNRDQQCDVGTQWIVPGLHKRSPEDFHQEVIKYRVNNTKIKRKLPAELRKSLFEEKPEDQLDPLQKSRNFLIGNLQKVLDYLTSGNFLPRSLIQSIEIPPLY
jgi:hypothetical protein